MPPYGAVQSYRPMATDSYPEYLTPAPVPVTLPSMTHFSDAIKREASYPGAPVDDGMPPYMSYNGYPLPGVDLSAGHPSPYDQMPHVSASSSSSSSRHQHHHHHPHHIPLGYHHGRARC